MLIVFFLLLFMYIGLTCFYAFVQIKSTPISSWPLLTLPPQDPKKIVSCRTTQDCLLNYVCLGNTCVPKLLRGGECDPAHGQWISYTLKGEFFAICSCFDNTLFSQKVFGGDCNVNVGCGPHGRYVPGKDEPCECDAGYVGVGFTCQKLNMLEYMKTLPCEDDEHKVSEIRVEDGFHTDYLAKLDPESCVKRPCSFDALSGRPLKHARYQHDWGCICDPKYGLFGVVLEGKDKKYLSSPGFDACASIFLKDPTQPMDVKLVTYFYLGEREPISFILFDQLIDANLIPVFREKMGQFMIRQSLWRYDYAQYFFKEHKQFNARTRKVYKDPMFGMEMTNEALYYDDFEPEFCNTPILAWLFRPQDRVSAYNVLYKSPVCKISDHDADADPIFRGRTVVNPNHITFKEFNLLHRFNAFVLQYNAVIGQWTLDLDYPFNMNLYQSIKTNAPYYDHLNRKP